MVAQIRALDPDLNLGLELADEWHHDRIEPSLQALLDAGISPHPPITGQVEQAIRTTTRGVSKLYLTAPDTVRVKIEHRFAQAGLRTGLTITSSGRNLVEIPVHTGPNRADGWAAAIERYVLNA